MQWGATAALGSALIAGAQVSSYGDKQAGENAGDQLPNVLNHVAIEQHLNQRLVLIVSSRSRKHEERFAVLENKRGRKSYSRALPRFKHIWVPGLEEK